MGLTAIIHGWRSEAEIRAGHKGDSIWVEGEEGDLEIKLFLDRDQATQVINALVASLGLTFEAVGVKDEDHGRPDRQEV